MTDNEMVTDILKNKSIKTAKEKAVAIYAVIAFLAYSGETERAKALAATRGTKFEG